MDYHTIIYLAHILFGLAWIYLGYYGLRKKISPGLYKALIPIALAIIAYHGYKLVVSDYHRWVYLFHIFVIALILGYVGYRKQATPQAIYYLIIIVGIIAIGYHGNILRQIWL